MDDFMILYQYTDEHGLHRSALFLESYEQAHAMIIGLVFVVGANAKMYKLNNKNDNYDFIEKWVPEKRGHERRLTNETSN